MCATDRWGSGSSPSWPASSSCWRSATSCRRWESFPYVSGGNDYGDHNLFYAIVWALLIWVWGWVTWALYSLNPQGWLVVMLASGFAAIFNFINIAAATQATPDLTLTFIVDVVIFAYALMPSTQKAFGLKDKLPPLNP